MITNRTQRDYAEALASGRIVFGDEGSTAPLGSGETAVVLLTPWGNERVNQRMP